MSRLYSTLSAAQVALGSRENAKGQRTVTRHVSLRIAFLGRNDVGRINDKQPQESRLAGRSVEARLTLRLAGLYSQFYSRRRGMQGLTASLGAVGRRGAEQLCRATR